MSPDPLSSPELSHLNSDLRNFPPQSLPQGVGNQTLRGSPCPLLGRRWRGLPPAETLPCRRVPWGCPPGGRGNGKPTHRGSLGPFQSVKSHCFVFFFPPSCWSPCPFSGLLRGDPPPPQHHVQARRNGAAQRHPRQIVLTGWTLGFTHSPPMFLIPWGPAGCGPLTWSQGEQGEACMELWVSPRGRRALYLGTKHCLGLAPNHMVRGTFFP